MPLELISVLGKKGSARKKLPADLGEEELREIYRQMLMIRIFDQRMLELQRQGRIGFYGPAKGQEATVVGCMQAASVQDWIVPALREGAMSMMRGLLNLGRAQDSEDPESRRWRDRDSRCDASVRFDRSQDRRRCRRLSFPLPPQVMPRRTESTAARDLSPSRCH